MTNLILKLIRSKLWIAITEWDLRHWLRRPRMNVKEIIIEYLKDNGYDGLYCDDCGCIIDDLIPCDNDCSHCVPGYKTASCGDYDFFMGPIKGAEVRLENDARTT